MKKVSSLLVILCITAFAFAQTPVTGTDPAVSTSAKPSKAQMEWSNGIVHDFGKITQNVPATYTFEFTNTGTDPVTITKAKPSCSCTVPEYSKQPVLPGKKGLVKATYDAHNPGVFNKTITVSTDGGDNVILRISGEVFPKK